MHHIIAVLTNLAETDDSFFVIIYNIYWKIWWHPLSRRMLNSQVKATGSNLDWTGCTYKHFIHYYIATQPEVSGKPQPGCTYIHMYTHRTDGETTRKYIASCSIYWSRPIVQSTVLYYAIRFTFTGRLQATAGFSVICKKLRSMAWQCYSQIHIIMKCIITRLQRISFWASCRHYKLCKQRKTVYVFADMVFFTEYSRILLKL